jgi:Cu(I)/Ag(I) efflux system membrane protein CusA/SilA
VLIASPAGVQVPLRELARIEPQRGPAMISSENGLLVGTVLLNVQGRDVGSFIAEARRAVAAQVVLPAGYYLGWSGRYENQEHARARLRLVVPIALAVIFVLLYFTYGSAIEAAHVLLAVPFALTGGVYLLWLTGYNFSVAVWVGFIALFGTAVQTAVVMVIYLEEAVDRARAAAGTGFDRAALRAAVIDGALLRLRPKIMTVSTVVAGLLPIMWSSRTGAEVMKPLATPVLGGMVSSLLHVLIVTPVIFYWLRARHLPVENDAPSIQPAQMDAAAGGRRWPFTMVLIAVLSLAATVAVWRMVERPGDAPVQRAVQSLEAGGLTISLRSESGTLTHGRNQFWIEFRDVRGQLIDAGDVRFSATMPMPGMVMSGGIEVLRSSRPGRYLAAGEFGMSGVWQMTLQWTGSPQPGSVGFQGSVQ